MGGGERVVLSQVDVSGELGFDDEGDEDDDRDDGDDDDDESHWLLFSGEK